MAGSFWSLVKHDFRSRKERRMPREWRIAYLVMIVLVFLTVATFQGRQARFDLNYVWYFTVGFVFVAFGQGASRIQSEWRQATVGWWLSLPMPRLRLVTAKFVSAVLRSVVIFAAAYGTAAVLGIYTMALDGSIPSEKVAHFLLTGLAWMAAMVCFAPIVAAIGLLFSVLRRSTASPVVPLLWIAFVGFWWLIGPFIGLILPIGPAGEPRALIIAPLVYAALISWLVTYLLIQVAAYLLDRYATV